MKKFISGFILGAFLFSIIPIYAATQQAINVSYKNIKILVNGKPVPTDAEPFIYNGQVFAPVETIAEALGKSYKYNETAGTVAIETPIPKPAGKLNSVDSIKAFLTENYSSLTTDVGTTAFTFSVAENKTNLISYDYRVMAYYDNHFLDNLQYSIAINSTTRESVKAQIKAHQENLANALISTMPNKKFFGGYYAQNSSGSTVQVDLDYYYSWANYKGSVLANYQNTHPSTFRWYSSIQGKREGD